jgi:hypothetical protein
MNCCDAYGNCHQGRDCPVRRENTEVIEQISREINAQIDAEQQRCSALATHNGGAQVVCGTSTPAPEAPYQWLDELFFRAAARVLLAVSALIAIGGAGYVYQRLWGG